jgi:hypothetical protein
VNLAELAKDPKHLLVFEPQEKRDHILKQIFLVRFLSRQFQVSQSPFYWRSIIARLIFTSFNSRSDFLVMRDQMPFNRNLGPLIINERTFTKWSIDYLNNWRLCVFFFENFYCITVLIFCKNFWNHQKKRFIVIRKVLRLFFHYTKAQKWSRDRIFKT